MIDVHILPIEYGALLYFSSVLHKRALWLFAGDYVLQVTTEKRARDLVAKRVDYDRQWTDYEQALSAQETAAVERKAYTQGRLKTRFHFAINKSLTLQQHYENVRLAKVSLF